MINLDLTIDEIQILREIVEANLEDLRVEIVSTDRLDFKEALKNRKAIVGQIMEKLEKELQYSH